MSKYIKSRWKFWLNIFTLGALVFLIYIIRDQIVDAFSNVNDLNLWVLSLVVPVQLCGYYAIAKLYKGFFDSQGNEVRLRELFKVVLELNFVNHVFPSGGVSGFSYLGIRLRSLGISVAKSTLAQMLRFALTFLTFIILLFIGMLSLSFGHSTSSFVILVSTGIISATIFSTGVAIFIISKIRRIKGFVSWLPKLLNYISGLFSSRKELINLKRLEKGLEDIHHDYKKLYRDKTLLKRLASWAFLVNATEILSIYLVYIAFGQLVNPGAIIIAYAVANFAGLVAVLPGGVGIYEGLMTAVMVSAGIGKALAVSGTVVFRVITMLIALPIGFILYRRALSNTGRAKVSNG